MFYGGFELNYIQITENQIDGFIIEMECGWGGCGPGQVRNDKILSLLKKDLMFSQR